MFLTIRANQTLLYELHVCICFALRSRDAVSHESQCDRCVNCINDGEAIKQAVTLGTERRASFLPYLLDARYAGMPVYAVYAGVATCMPGSHQHKLLNN